MLWNKIVANLQTITVTNEEPPLSIPRYFITLGITAGIFVGKERGGREGLVADVT
jgi:hypothetical protein